MKPTTLWSERLDVLSAAASPWSTLAYGLGRETFQREIAPEATSGDGNGCSQAAKRVASESAGRATNRDGSGDRGVTRWVRRALDRFEVWSWQRQVRSQEAYLARAHDLADLEQRLRRLDGTTHTSGTKTSQDHSNRQTLLSRSPVLTAKSTMRCK